MVVDVSQVDPDRGVTENGGTSSSSTTSIGLRDNDEAPPGLGFKVQFGRGGDGDDAG